VPASVPAFIVVVAFIEEMTLRVGVRGYDD
jgi:hypothetical protein